MAASHSAHNIWMRRCYHLAQQAVNHGNHPFGALLVRGDVLVHSSENSVVSNNDNTRHAELNVLQQAAAKGLLSNPEELTLYTSTEPCAMCSGAIYWAGIGALVYGCPAAELGRITGGSLAIPCHDILQRGRREVSINGPVLPEEGLDLHRNFWNPAPP